MGLLSAIYSSALSCRRFFYKSGLAKSKKLPVKVLSIGNLTLGGTGKTPAVIAVAHEAIKRGYKPCILTRGYKSKVKGPCFVSRGEGSLLDAFQAGDEPVLMAERLEQVPIVIGKNRYDSGTFAIKELHKQILNLPAGRQGPKSNILFILDDGFQHRGLQRDIDVLLIDACNPFGNGKLFPEGILREPITAVSRADTVVITRTDTSCSETINSIKNKVWNHCPETEIFTSFHKPVSVIELSGKEKNMASLKETEVYAFAGLANNDHFASVLVSHGARIKKFRSFRDHYYYRQRDIDKIKGEAQGADIITTEKDMVKLKSLNLPVNLSALRIEFSIDKGFYKRIFNIIDV